MIENSQQIIQNQPPTSTTNQPETATKPAALKEKIVLKLKILPTLAKKPKILSLIALILILIVIVLALNLISQNGKEDEATVPPVPRAVQSPSPSADTNTQNIIKNVEAYNAQIDSLINYRQQLLYPIVDLEISFE